MRAALVFVLLFAAVLCRPARKGSDSSESSEEVRRRPAGPAYRERTAAAPQDRAPVQDVSSDASVGTSEEDQVGTSEDQVAALAPETLTSDLTDSFSGPASVHSSASDDDEEEEEEDDDDSDEDDSDSLDSDETSSPAPTGSPEVFTEEPLAETTPEPILPTIVIDTGRGDSMGGQPDDYKSIIYFEDKSYHKVPLPYKSYEYVDAGKKTGYELDRSNHVDKSMQVYKIQSLQVHPDLLEEDTSTPEMDNQAMDLSSSTSQDPDPLAEEGDSAGTGEIGSSSSPEEEQEEQEEQSPSSSTESSSTSPEESSEEEQEEQSDSSQSRSDEDAAAAVLAAK